MASAPGKGKKGPPAPRGAERAQAPTDDCELSYDEGQLRVAFFRGDTLIYRLLLIPPGALRLADRLDNRSESRQVRLAGGVLMNRDNARSVAHQLRGLAGMLRAAPHLLDRLAPTGSSTPPSTPPSSPPGSSDRANAAEAALGDRAVERAPVEHDTVESDTVDDDTVDDDPEEAAQ